MDSYFSFRKLFIGHTLFLDRISVGDFYFYFYRLNSPIAQTIFYFSAILFVNSVEKSSFERSYQLDASYVSQFDGGIKVVS